MYIITFIWIICIIQSLEYTRHVYTSNAQNEPAQGPGITMGMPSQREVQVVDPSKVYDGLEKPYHFAPIGPSRSATEVTPFQLQEAPGVKEQICADDDLKEIFMLGGRKKCWLRSPKFNAEFCSVKKSPEVAGWRGAVGWRVTWLEMPCEPTAWWHRCYVRFCGTYWTFDEIWWHLNYNPI